MTPRIVVLNFTRMGDILQSGPLLRSLKNAQPQSRISLVVFDAFRDVAQRLPMVDEVIGFQADDMVAALDGKRGDIGKGIRTLNQLLEREALRDADLLINLSHTPLSATLAMILKPRQVWGMQRTASGNLTVNGNAFHYLYSIMDERRWNPFNLVEIYQRIHAASSFSPYLEFDLTADDERAAGEMLRECGLENHQPFCVMQAGASGPERRWPTESFARLADGLRDAGYRTVLVGTKDEQSLAQEIASRSHGEISSLTGRTTIGVLGAVLARAHRLVSNDTGTIHLAAAVGTRTVGLFLGPASAKDTAPYGSGHIILEPDLECAPCSYQKTCNDLRCHRVVTVEQVLALTLADENVEAVAAPMTGTRIYRTRVHSDGAFELLPLNSFCTGTDLRRLKALRSFWNGLFDDNAMDPRNRSVEGRDLAELRAIWRTADTSLKTLCQLVQKTPINAEGLAQQIQDQLVWQKRLRDFVDRYPDLAPFPKFLLARTNKMHTDNLSVYLTDLLDILRQFDKGMRRLAAAPAAITENRESHATTA